MICGRLQGVLCKQTIFDYVVHLKKYHVRGPPLDSQGGGGRSIFEINNLGRTLREINNLLQELLYINM